MIFIYDKKTGEVKAFYQGDISQIHNYETDGWGEAQFSDDPEVIERPHDYKVVVIAEQPIAYCKKPKLELILDKDKIIGDGQDVATLTVNVTEAHPLEQVRYDTATIRVNNDELEVANGESVTITSVEDHFAIVFTGNPNQFRVTPVTLEVI